MENTKSTSSSRRLLPRQQMCMSCPHAMLIIGAHGCRLGESRAIFDCIAARAGSRTMTFGGWVIETTAQSGVDFAVLTMPLPSAKKLVEAE